MGEIEARDDPGHRRETHRRWVERRNRKQESPDYRDEWYAEQCGHCRYWIPLSGPWRTDWGGCSNPASPFDGRIQFEHDGCDEFEAAEEWA